MNSLDDHAKVQLQTCKAFVDSLFDSTIGVLYSPGTNHLYVDEVAPADGGDIRCFDPSSKDWIVMDDPCVASTFVHDGNVFITYRLQDPEDSGMYLKLGHPREFAELLQLFVNPRACFAATDYLLEARPLAEVFDRHVLIPDGRTWRSLDCSALPASATGEVRQALRANLVRNWDDLLNGLTVPAHELAARWPAFVHSLPEASNVLRSGYILEYTGHVRAAVDRVVTPPSDNDLFLDMVLVPSRPDTSAWYLREFLSGDAALGAEIQRVFTGSADFESLVSRLGGAKIELPKGYHDQIRIAAEHDSIRQWLLATAESLANKRSYFHARAQEQWHIAHTLNQLNH